MSHLLIPYWEWPLGSSSAITYSSIASATSTLALVLILCLPLLNLPPISNLHTFFVALPSYLHVTCPKFPNHYSLPSSPVIHTMPVLRWMSKAWFYPAECQWFVPQQRAYLQAWGHIAGAVRHRCLRWHVSRRIISLWYNDGWQCDWQDSCRALRFRVSKVCIRCIRYIRCIAPIYFMLFVKYPYIYVFMDS